MQRGRTIFAQLMEHAPHAAFQRCVQRYPSRYRLRRFSHWDHFLVMAFAHLTYCGNESAGGPTVVHRPSAGM